MCEGPPRWGGAHGLRAVEDAAGPFVQSSVDAGDGSGPWRSWQDQLPGWWRSWVRQVVSAGDTHGVETGQTTPSRYGAAGAAHMSFPSGRLAGLEC